jgi:hypothetical protein
MPQNRYLFYAALVPFCIAIGLLVLSILPYAQFKTFFDSLMLDRDFESLQDSNAFIFRVFVILVGLGILVFALLMAGKWQLDGNRLRQDVASLVRSLLPDRDEKWFSAALVGVTLWGGAIRLIYLNEPVGHDEAYSVTVFSPSLWYAITNYHAPNNHILHTVLVHFSTTFLGFYPWAVRVPAFLAGTLIIPVAYGLGKIVYDRYTALLAAVLIAWWPVQVSYSVTARGYSLVALFALMTLWLGVLARREKNLVVWSLIVVFSALGFYTVPVMLIPFGVLFIWLFLENLLAEPGQGYRSKWEFTIHWLLAGLASAFLSLLFYSPILIYGGMKFFQIGQPNPLNVLGPLFLENLKGMYYEWVGGIAVFGVLVLGIGILLSLIFHRRLSTLHVPLQIAAVIWIGLILAVQRPNAWSRIWFSLAALFMIWASAGLIGSIKSFHLHRLRDVSIATIMILFLFAGTFVAGVRRLADFPRIWKGSGREELAIMYLKDEIRANDIIVAPTPQDAPLWYYSRLHGIPERYFRRTTEFNHAYIITVPVLGQYREAVIMDFGLTDVIDLDSLKLIKEINGMNIYEAIHK